MSALRIEVTAREMQMLRDALASLRRVNSNWWPPGMTAEIDELETRLRQLSALYGEHNRTAGNGDE